MILFVLPSILCIAHFLLFLLLLLIHLIFLQKCFLSTFFLVSTTKTAKILLCLLLLLLLVLMLVLSDLMRIVCYIHISGMYYSFLHNLFLFHHNLLYCY